MAQSRNERISAAEEESVKRFTVFTEAVMTSSATDTEKATILQAGRLYVESIGKFCRVTLSDREV